MAKFAYKLMQLRTLKAIKQAERLQAKGWHPISTGIDVVLMEKKLNE